MSFRLGKSLSTTFCPSIQHLLVSFERWRLVVHHLISICGWLEKIILEDIVKAGIRNFGNHFLHHNLKKSGNYPLLVSEISEIFVLTTAKNDGNYLLRDSEIFEITAVD